MTTASESFIDYWQHPRASLEGAVVFGVIQVRTGSGENAWGIQAALSGPRMLWPSVAIQSILTLHVDRAEPLHTRTCGRLAARESRFRSLADRQSPANHRGARDRWVRDARSVDSEVVEVAAEC